MIIAINVSNLYFVLKYIYIFNLEKNQIFIKFNLVLSENSVMI